MPSESKPKVSRTAARRQAIEVVQVRSGPSPPDLNKTQEYCRLLLLTVKLERGIWLVVQT